MSLPKKRKSDNNIIDGKILGDRVEQIMSESDLKSTYLPKSILIKDLDQGFNDLLEDGELELTIDEKKVPVIFMSNERWAEFSKTWVMVNDDNNVVPPFITIKRSDVKQGTYIEKYSIPNRKVFTYLKVPTYKDRILGYDLYKIPQPTPIDITYEVKFFTRYLIDVNSFYELYLNKYYDRQLYININGHYIQTLMEDLSSDDTIDNVEGDRYYVKTISILLRGYIQEEKDFKIVETKNRITNIVEINNKEVLRDTSNISPKHKIDSYD